MPLAPSGSVPLTDLVQKGMRCPRHGPRRQPFARPKHCTSVGFLLKCPDMPKCHHVQGRHEKLWMWSVFNQNAQHWLKINCSRTLYWGKIHVPIDFLWNQSIGDVNYHIISLSTARLPLLFHQSSPCWGTTSFLWSWTRQAVMIIMQPLDSVRVSRLNPKSSRMFSKTFDFGLGSFAIHMECSEEFQLTH